MASSRDVRLVETQDEHGEDSQDDLSDLLRRQKTLGNGLWESDDEGRTDIMGPLEVVCPMPGLCGGPGGTAAGDAPPDAAWGQPGRTMGEHPPWKNQKILPVIPMIGGTTGMYGGLMSGTRNEPEGA